MHFAAFALPGLLCIPSVLAGFLTGTYPPPIDLSSNNSVVAASWKNLTQGFDSALKSNDANASKTFAAVRNVTFSAGLFSIHDPAASKLQYHYTSPEIAKAPNGTNKVDGSSIYRVASVSKLVTVYLGMLTLTNDDWNTPISRFIPEFTTAGSSGVDTIDWEQITPWALATQLAGIPQIGVAIADRLLQYEAALAGVGGLTLDMVQNPITELGLPPENITVLGPCLDYTCSAATFAESVRTQTPIFETWTSPAYSDLAFMLLGFVISAKTGMPIESAYQQHIFEPLGMDSSSSVLPTEQAELARCVVPDNAFFSPGGLTSPSGGIFSTISDLDKFGIALLNSTQLPANVTRKWMKPVTHTASLTYSVGGPWEIHRYIHPATGKVTDLYTKLGDSGDQGGVVIAIPEYGAGITMVAASSNEVVRSAVDNIVLDYIVNAILPALETQAAVEAGANYVGTYVSTDPNLNSSVTITLDKSTNPGHPTGLSVSRWISNGTDALNGTFPGAVPVLLPSIPKQPTEGRGQVAFQASDFLQTNSYVGKNVPDSVIGVFTGAYGTNLDWMGAGNQYYANVGMKMFVFDVDAEGNATALTPGATRAKLQRRA